MRATEIIRGVLDLIDGIDHAGVGINGPKYPSDIRADSVAMYPAHQHGVR